MLVCYVCFQLGSLHISKGVVYNANNNVSSLVYQMHVATGQGQQWVVSFRRYRVVGDNVYSHSQKTILTTRTTTSMVKAMFLIGNKTEDIFYVDVEFHIFDTTPSGESTLR